MVDKALYPFKNHYFHNKGWRYHYLDEGPADAEPVLMVHGNPTWSFYYRNLVQGIKSEYRAIAPDHLGCGLSDKPKKNQYPYSLDQRVEDLEALIEHLDLKQKIHLVVHDWGGMIGMTWARRNPERVKSIVVTNTAAFHLPVTKKFPWPLRVCRSAAIGPLLVQGLNMFTRAANKTCTTRQALSKEIQKAYAEPHSNWNDRTSVLRFVQDIPIKESEPSYKTVSETEAALSSLQHIPMMICWGAKDWVFDDHFLTQWQQHFPKAEVHRFPDVGHYILEDAWEEILPLVRNFLTSF